MMSTEVISYRYGALVDNGVHPVHWDTFTPYWLLKTCPPCHDDDGTDAEAVYANVNRTDACPSVVSGLRGMPRFQLKVCLAKPIQARPPPVQPVHDSLHQVVLIYPQWLGRTA